MSQLSKAISNIGNDATAFGKQVIHQPLNALANSLTLGQFQVLKNAYEKSPTLTNFYNKNKLALLTGGASGIVTGGIAPLIGHKIDQSNEKAQQKVDDAQKNQDQGNQDLNNIINGIGGGGPSNNPTVGPNVPQQRPGVRPTDPTNYSNGSSQVPTGSLPFDSLPSDLQQTMAQQSPALQSRLNQIIGPGNGQAQTNANQIMNATDLAAQMSKGTLDTQAADRKQQISDLSNLLTEQAKTQYERSLPSLYEDLNTRGLLRSSDLGTQMALKEQQSYQDVASQLGQTQLGYNDQYINGLSDITNKYNAGTGSALQREFSLQDYANQLQAAKSLGQAVTPVQPYNGKGTTQLATTALGAAGPIMQGGAALAAK